jgi:hypothetical protein
MKAVLICFIMLMPLHAQRALAQQNPYIGAWEISKEGNRIVMICSEKYFVATVYNDKEFSGTCGGRYSVKDDVWVETHEFNTMKPELIGKETKTSVELKNNELMFSGDTVKGSWKKLDNGTPGKLAGAWLITGRMQDNEMTNITPGVRRTMKILSGTRFQWIAYNVDTKEFLGTGGGTYSTTENEYTEVIEFFSRDITRVGKSLTFEFSLIDGDWRHKGLSSKGEPIDEVWTKREKLGL